MDDITQDLYKLEADQVHLQGVKTPCLLYADDLLMMSTTAGGLQRQIDMLQIYTSTWGLTVNVNKPKVMVFGNVGKHVDQPFIYNNKELERVDHFSYLGLTLTSNGSFKTAVADLKAKAAKAMFKIHAILRDQNVNCIPVALKLFDSLV